MLATDGEAKRCWSGTVSDLFKAPTETDLLAFFAAMDANQKEKLWIHCAANIRVSAFIGLYRVIRLGWEEERAFALMHELWKPDMVWERFIAAMLESAANLNSPATAAGQTAGCRRA